MVDQIHNTASATQARPPLPAARLRRSNRNIPNRDTPIIKSPPKQLKTNEKRFSNRNCLLRLDRESRLAARPGEARPPAVVRLTRITVLTALGPRCLPAVGETLQSFLLLPGAASVATTVNDGSPSRKRFLTRYTYRVRKGLFSFAINNITKNYSIHFWHVRERRFYRPAPSQFGE